MGNVYPFASVAFQSLGALALGPAEVVICGAAGPGQSQAALLQRLREGSGNRVAWSDIVPGQDPEHCLGTQKAGDRLKAGPTKLQQHWFAHPMHLARLLNRSCCLPGCCNCCGL